MRTNLSFFLSKSLTAFNKLVLSCFILMVICSGLSAQNSDPNKSFNFITRLAATGSSHSSDPEGYKAYSSIHFDVSLRRCFTSTLSGEFNLAHESREVDFMGHDEEISLGSMEMLPVNLSVQYHPHLKKWHPYIGIGVNFTIFWEKSGELNRKKLSPSIGPNAQLGLDFPILPNAFLNLDVKFMLLKTDFEGPNKETVKLSVDPTVIGVGLGFQF